MKTCPLCDEPFKETLATPGPLCGSEQCETEARYLGLVPAVTA